MIPPKIFFQPPDQALLDSIETGVFDPVSAYQLNLRARRLKLVQGFQELASLPMLRNVESFAYQTETALRVLRRYQGRALLCDEVGLGKTVEAGIIFKEYALRGLVKKALVLTPPGLTGQWREELSSKFELESVSPEDDAFRERGPDAWSFFPIVVASLSLAKRPPHAGLISKVHYDLVIVDEAHRLRNRASVAWKFVNGLEKKFLLLLTATPVQNDLEELFNLVTLLKPGQLNTLKDFKSRFVERADPRKPKNAQALRELLADCMVRNTRSQIDRRLPPRRAHTIRLPLTEPERALYDQTTAYLRSLFPESAEAPCGTAGGAPDRPSPAEDRRPAFAKPVLRTLQKELGSSPAAFAATVKSLLDRPGLAPGHRVFFTEALERASGIRHTAKGRALVDLLKSMPSQKAVIFTTYRRTLEELEALLASQGLRAGVYHGGLTRFQKDDVVHRFQGDLPLLLSTEAGGEGRNLQFCRVLINFDLPYNPMKIEQRVGRIHRIGQTQAVSIYNLAAEDTLEDSLIKILDEKINMFELVIGELDMVLGQLEEEGDFEDLLLDLWWKAKSSDDWNASVEELGQRLLAAKKNYLGARALDEEIFQQDFAAV